jgi:hypothetical protein
MPHKLAFVGPSACCIRAQAIPAPFALTTGQQPYCVTQFSNMEAEVVLFCSDPLVLISCLVPLCGLLSHMPNFRLYVSARHSCEHRILY